MTDFPDLPTLLSSGHDHRLTLDASGRNHYFCQPEPHPKLQRFGSSTASNVSPEQWALAQKIHRVMRAEAQQQTEPSFIFQYTQRIQQAIQQHCQLPQNSHITLAESGTHAHRIFAQFLFAKHPKEHWHITMVDASETGREVPQAIMPDGYTIDYHMVPIRHKFGEPRHLDDIHRDMQEDIQKAIQQQRKVLLIMVDSSKTGFHAPTMDKALQWQSFAPEHVHLFLDACQLRLDTCTLKDYLQQGITVAITGSKFLAAPSFCAALLQPQAYAQESPTPPSLGLLLRWQLALHTLTSFHSLSAPDKTSLMRAIHSFTSAFIQQHEALEGVHTPHIQRQKQPCWHDYPNIFPFFISLHGKRLRYTDALKLYQTLQLDKDNPVQLGRPMPVGHQQDGLFRLSISAPMMITAIQHNTQAQLLASIQQALLQTIQQAKKFPSLRT